jgi:hypothetical protein
MDKNERLTFVGIAGMSQLKIRGPSNARIVSPRNCEEPRKARIPGFLDAYESGEDNLLKDPAGGKHKLSRFADAGVQRLTRVRAW